MLSKDDIPTSMTCGSPGNAHTERGAPGITHGETHGETMKAKHYAGIAIGALGVASGCIFLVPPEEDEPCGAILLWPRRSEP